MTSQPSPGTSRQPQGATPAGVRPSNRVLVTGASTGIGRATGQDNHEEFGAALAGPSKLQDYLERQAQALAGVTGQAGGGVGSTS